jgi:hypothetical protein
MSDLIARAEAAIAAWKSGGVNHALHVELAELVQSFHGLHNAEPKQPAAPIDIPLPPKEASPE